MATQSTKPAAATSSAAAAAVHHEADAHVVEQIATLLAEGAAPGELDGFGEAQRLAAGRLAASAMADRTPGEPVILIDRHAPGNAAARRIGLVIVNDDMPFLVDSTTLAVAAAGLDVARLLHPVVEVSRDGAGRLVALHGRAARGATGAGRSAESIIYMELTRASGGARQRLEAELAQVLRQIKIAVRDWKPMLAALQAAARRLVEHPAPAAPHENAEDVAFLEWLADDHLTILGWRGYRLEGEGEAALLVEDEPGLGLLSDPAIRMWRGLGADSPETPLQMTLRPRALQIAKCDLVSMVHRRAPCDYISVKRFDHTGRVVGEDRIIGLFTSAALGTKPREVPLVRRRVAQVIADSGFDPKGHTGKALAHVLDNFPREDLLQTPVARLKDVTLGILSLLDRPRPKLFIGPDPFGRRVFALVFVPRDQFSGEMRLLIGRMLEQAVGSGLDHYGVELRADGLARLSFVFGISGGPVPQFDEAALERRLTELVRGWDEALEAELSAKVGPVRAARIALDQKRIFSTSYRSQFSAAEAAEDIVRLSGLTRVGDHEVRIYRRTEDAAAQLRLKIYHLETIVSLSDAVPVLERFGFRVIEEFPFDVDLGSRGWVHDFLLELPGGLGAVDTFAARVEPALKRVLDGLNENDAFNALVIAAELDAEAVGWLRAYYRYYHQTGAAATQLSVVDALKRNPAVARGLVALFRARHAPGEGHREKAVVSARTDVITNLEAVELIDDDRILRFYLAVIDATLRTNAFVEAGREALAFKIDSAGVPGLPPPVPYREIFLYSPRVEGVHLRGGPVARGGIRWSDRRDDYRTEVLGLLKAQIVKNAVIVPTGAKGGFFPRALPPAANRDAWLAEGAECYRIFIRSLLSLTDNIVEGAVVPPAGVVRHDGDDPYLVVAADKGTATFSDNANQISLHSSFWLGDAFASGGSVGYDHKAMGITARGAWVSVQRHFAELGRDVQTEPTTVVGCGDMSGDVFGNGMLLSKALKLIAAFDHRDIFLDPDPDPAVSWEERNRLFQLPRSSWTDYDPAKISEGGGVFPRTQKMIPLTPQVRAVLGVEAEELGPNDLIRAVLKAPVDLLWLGGIGTYVKADSESHVEVGDRANDANRVDGRDLRVQVVGEGANLGFTQAGRIEFARADGRINTDFIDNSAGVDTSDHEVNIKIALQPVVQAKRLSTDDRIALLESMTDAVAALVLEDNARQTQALSLAERGGARAAPGYIRLIQQLEDTRGLDRSVEGLPSDDLLLQRAQAGEGLARPELAVVLSYAKLAVYDALVTSAVVEDPILERDLLAGMPVELAARFPEALHGHRLRRELIATAISNELVNRGGLTLAFELAEEGGAKLAQVCGAFVATRELFAMPQLWAAIDALPPDRLQLRLMADAADGLRVHMTDILRCHAPETLAPSDVIAAAADGLARIDAKLDEVLRPEPRATLAAMRADLDKAGAPAAVAERLVRIQALDGGITTAAAARALSVPEIRVAEAYTMLGHRLGLDWAKGRANALSPSDPWERLLVANARRDLEQIRFDLICRVTAGGMDPVAAAEGWLAAHADCQALILRTVDRARRGAATTSAMLAHIAAQARVALGGVSGG